MKKLLCLLLFVIAMMNLQAQDYEESEQKYTVEGTVTNISKDSVLTIKIIVEPEVAPSVKQKVDVTKKFVMGNVKGTMGVADGQILSYGNGIVKVQVLKYTSTMEQDGKIIPLIKVENTTVLTWKMKPVPTYASEYRKAKRMMTDKKYDEAVLLLDSLLKVKKDVDALYSRGCCRIKLEQYDASNVDLNEVLKLNPDHQMGYYMRAISFTQQEKYESAIKDVEYLLTQDLNKESEIQMLKDHVFLLNKAYKYNVDKKQLCKDYTRLCQLDSDNMSYYNEKNRNCNTYTIEKFTSNYLPIVATYQSRNKFTISTKMLKKGKYKWYEKAHTLNKKIEVGTYINLVEVSEGVSMNIAIAKVTKVDGAEVQLEIEYWSNRMNNEPIMYNLMEQKSDYVIEW